MSAKIPNASWKGLVRPVRLGSSCRFKPTISPQQTRHQHPPASYPASTTPYEPRPYAERYTDRPRWSTTPPRYSAPYRSKLPVEGTGTEHPVNEDPDKLDEVYDNIFGSGGHKLFREEVKWQAVTHKSFDHGKRGYNERLALMGRNILDLPLCLSFIHSSSASKGTSAQVDDYKREPFHHPALEGIEKLTWDSKQHAVNRTELSVLARHYGLPGILRWKPRYPRRLESSGESKVLAEALYAIIGALNLEQGAPVANTLIRERILDRLIPK